MVAFCLHEERLNEWRRATTYVHELLDHAWPIRPHTESTSKAQVEGDRIAFYAIRWRFSFRDSVPLLPTKVPNIDA